MPDVSVRTRQPQKRVECKAVISRLPSDSGGGTKISSQNLIVPVEFTRCPGLPLPRAAHAVGVSHTAFKRACRRLGIARWDYKGRGRRQPSDRGAGNAHADAIARAGAMPITCHSKMVLLRPSRYLPGLCPAAVTPAWQDFKPLLPARSGAAFAGSEFGPGLADETPAPPPAAPQSAGLELGWPVPGEETEAGGLGADWDRGLGGWGRGPGTLGWGRRRTTRWCWRCWPGRGRAGPSS
jgi:hypothetical protein